MAISGSAFAQGLLMGAGQAGQKYFEDMRRQRFDNMKMEKTFNMFKKQTDYSAAVQAQKEKGVAMYKAGLADIKTKNKQRAEWERVSKMNVSDIVYENAIKASENFAPTDRPSFVRDYIKRRNGIDKATAMNDRGLTLPDYSQYKDKDDFKDAIPKQYLAGVPELPDADSMFAFDPQAGYMQDLGKQAEKLDVYDKKKRDNIAVIKDATLVNFQAEPSQAVAEYLWMKRPDGEDAVMKGADVVSMDNTRLASMIQSGQVVKIGGQLKFKRELDDEERQLLGMPPRVAPEATKGATETPAYAGKEFTEPTTEAYIAEKEAKEAQEAQIKAAKNVGDKHGKLISSYGALEELRAATEGLSEGAQAYLYGDASWKGMGAVSDKVTQLAAKAGDPAAQEAATYLSLVTNITARIKHDQYGSAQTATELADFASQLGRPGIFQNPQTFLDQIDARKASVGRDIRSSIGASDRDAYLAQHKEDPYLAAAFGVAEEAPAGQNGQVSDSAGTPQTSQFTLEGIEKFADEAIKAGTYSEDQRQQLIDFMKQKAGIK